MVLQLGIYGVSKSSTIIHLHENVCVIVVSGAMVMQARFKSALFIYILKKFYGTFLGNMDIMVYIYLCLILSV